MLHEGMFSALLRDYITAGGANLPADMLAVQHEIHTGTKEIQIPSFLYLTTFDEGSNARKKVIKTTIALNTIRPIEGDQNPLQPGTALLWMEALRSRVWDYVAFGDWLTSLPIDRRLGWRFLRWPRCGESGVTMDEDQRRQTFTQAIHWTVMMD